MYRTNRSSAYQGLIPSALTRVKTRVVAILHRRFPVIMRGTLGLVFLWFGALKVANVSPVSALVADTLSFVPLPASFVVPALGVFEIAVALALITGRWLRPFLPVLLLHLVGTFLVLALHPSVAFKDGNPLMLTMEGEFVVKNVVLIAGTLMVAATLPPRGTPEEPSRESRLPVSGTARH